MNDYSIGEDEIAAIVSGVVSGLDDSAEIGRRHGRHHGHHGGGGGAPKRIDLAALAASKGYRLVPMGSTPGETMGNLGIVPSNQRRQLIAFAEALGLAASAPVSLLGKVQKAIQVERLIVEARFAVSGLDASAFVRITDVKVGVRSQLATVGSLTLGMFNANAWGSNMILDAARTGNDFTIIGNVLASAPAAINIFVGGVGLSAE